MTATMESSDILSIAKEKFYNTVDEVIPYNLTSCLLSLDKELRIMVPGVGACKLSDNAQGQLADKINIPRGFFKRMMDGGGGDVDAEESRSNLMSLVNMWSNAESKSGRQWMMRVDKRTNTIFAVVSDKYLRLTPYKMISTALDHAYDNEMEVAGCGVNDDHSTYWLKVVSPKHNFTPRVGDTVQVGISFKFNDNGNHSQEHKLFTRQLICLNGMVATRSGFGFTYVHKKRKDWLEAHHQIDVVKNISTCCSLLIPSYKNMVSNVVYNAQRSSVNPRAKSVEEYVTGIYSKFGLNVTESENAFKHYVSNNNNTVWGISESVTRVAQDAQSYERRDELESIGFDIVSKTMEIA